MVDHSVATVILGEIDIDIHKGLSIWTTRIQNVVAFLELVEKYEGRFLALLTDDGVRSFDWHAQNVTGRTLGCVNTAMSNHVGGLFFFFLSSAATNTIQIRTLGGRDLLHRVGMLVGGHDLLRRVGTQVGGHDLLRRVGIVIVGSHGGSFHGQGTVLRREVVRSAGRADIPASV